MLELRMPVWPGVQASPVNAVVVLSRADEIGAARPDALDSARAIAARYAANPHVRELERRLHILHLAMARRAHLLQRPAELVPHLRGFTPSQRQEVDIVSLAPLCRHGARRPK